MGWDRMARLGAVSDIAHHAIEGAHAGQSTLGTDSAGAVLLQLYACECADHSSPDWECGGVNWGGGGGMPLDADALSSTEFLRRRLRPDKRCDAGTDAAAGKIVSSHSTSDSSSIPQIGSQAGPPRVVPLSL
jgi:hypothetical protein